MPGRLQDKVVIVAGASRGLGRDCAIGYGREGATVVVAARTEDSKNSRLPGTIYETARMVEEAGGIAYPLVCNVADNASVNAMVSRVLERYGQIDVLMTNAAIKPPGTFASMEIRHWELEINVNILGPFYCMRAVLPAMIHQQSGNIINISSRAALGSSHYGATKRVIELMTLALADEVRNKGISINCLKPVSAITTPGALSMGYSVQSESSPPDSYVEAAVLLSLQTPATCTGAILTDAEVLKTISTDSEFQRYSEVNARDWQESVRHFTPATYHPAH